MVTPVFLVIREYNSLAVAIVILICTSTFLKFNWWNKLESTYGNHTLEGETKTNEIAEPELVVESK